MIQVLCFLVPPFISVLLYEKILKRIFSVKEFLTKYMILTGIINMLCFGVIAILFHHPDYVVGSNMFLASFSCKYLLLSCFFSGITPAVFEIGKRGLIRYNQILESVSKALDKKAKLFLSVLISFFFAFTIIVFAPYDMFFGNQADFIFSFSDFWWIIASFGIFVFVVLATVIYFLPGKLFVISALGVFGFTLCCYIQRMFLNLYITSMTGETLNVREHPIWCVANLFGCIIVRRTAPLRFLVPAS